MPLSSSRIGRSRRSLRAIFVLALLLLASSAPLLAAEADLALRVEERLERIVALLEALREEAALERRQQEVGLALEALSLKERTVAANPFLPA